MKLLSSRKAAWILSVGVALASAGCFGSRFDGLLVNNFTDGPASIQVVISSEGHEAYNRTTSLGSHNSTMIPLQIASGQYQVTARSGTLERTESVAISREVRHVKIELTPSQLTVSKAT